MPLNVQCSCQSNSLSSFISIDSSKFPLEIRSGAEEQSSGRKMSLPEVWKLVHQSRTCGVSFEKVMPMGGSSQDLCGIGIGRGNFLAYIGS